MLVVIAAAALRLSTAAAYAAANDVRRSVLLFILVASGAAAIYLPCKRRAFWADFFASMLLCGNSSLQSPFKLDRYVPDFIWLAESADNFVPAPTYSNPPVQPLVSPVPQIGSTGPPLAYVMPSMPVRANPPAPSLLFAAIGTAWILTLAVVSGFIAATIYEYGHATKSD
jgi:hypothetical protein